MVWPIDTPGYAAQAAPMSYSYDSVSDYVKAGFVYVLAGMRRRQGMSGTSDTALSYSCGAPWGITDLKAAIRYIRYNLNVLPGDTDNFYTYGMSGGGAQSALAGATGNSVLYTPYLESIGAAMTYRNGTAVNDAVTGSMCWCPVTDLDIADEAYEWNMGQYFDTDTRASSTFTSALSADMAAEFADYINQMGLKSEDGTTLSLTKSDTGICNAGSYYDYMKTEIETSLNNFLSDNSFPYTYTATAVQVGNTPTSGGAQGFAQANGDQGTGVPTGAQGMPSGTKPDGDGHGMAAGGAGMPGGGSSSSESVVYQTPQDYIDSLNKDGKWISYDAAANKATITNVGDFVKNCKNPSKPVGAFDVLDKSRGENNLFGNAENTAAHFDAFENALLIKNQTKYAKFSDWKASCLTDFAADLAAKDEIGTVMTTRSDMYNPMYFLSDYYDGYKTSNVAKYWRIRTGINQSDTALCTEEDLKLALKNYGVKSVDFATVWGQPHTTAERTGNSTDNFIAWVNDCTAE